MNRSTIFCFRPHHIVFYLFFCFFFPPLFSQQNKTAVIQGSIKDNNGNPIEYATIFLKGKNNGTQSDKAGNYILYVVPGKYTFCVQFIGYETYEHSIVVKSGEKVTLDVKLSEKAYNLQEIVVQSKSSVQRINESAYNVVALDAKAQYNSTANLSNMLNKVSGVKIRESGGVGSDLQVMMDGFNGKHIKVFIDGIPQEGVGNSFGLNNIPVNYAERIEVYKGVVPVDFGTDAIGGVINIVTKKDFYKKWHLDASYSYGSFNTHKSYVNYGQSFDNGLVYEISAFQNYSDNNYYIDTPVKEFLADGSSSTNRSKIEHVKRFHDTYHNEAAIGKIGLTNKKWADRLMLGITYSKSYKDIQNGVRQEIVFGGKYRNGYSIMPSLEYMKKNFFVNGLNVSLTANYNKNITNNVDTTSYEYNWRGEKRLIKSPGEQSYQNTRSYNDNWNGTFTVNYTVKRIHSFTFNNVVNTFERNNRSMLTSDSEKNAIAKETKKNISGLSYRLHPTKKWNASVFAKHYYQFVAGPVATSDKLDDYVRDTKSIRSTGYGAAGTFFIFDKLQSKLSYEKVYRLPSNNEMFGDEDLESGDSTLKPESSNNINFNLSFSETFGEHTVYLEGGLIYRNIKDYIQRQTQSAGGGKYIATNINHGKVLTKGYNIMVRYDFSKWLSFGGNFSKIDTRDNVKTYTTGSANLAYKARMPNVPYLFANSDATFYWRNLFEKGNVLTFAYDNFYVKRFPLYSEALGSESKFIVPTQFSHNASISYSMENGRYTLSFECQNITDTELYDNFSLQKAGRAFYGKFRISL